MLHQLRFGSGELLMLIAAIALGAVAVYIRASGRWFLTGLVLLALSTGLASFTLFKANYNYHDEVVRRDLQSQGCDVVGVDYRDWRVVIRLNGLKTTEVFFKLNSDPHYRLAIDRFGNNWIGLSATETKAFCDAHQPKLTP